MRTTDEIFAALSPADRDCTAYDHGKYMQNLFTGNVVYNESFLPIAEKDGRVAPIRLMYPVDRVLALHDATLARTYTQGVDFVVEDGCIVLTEGTSMPYMRWDELFTTQKTDILSIEEGRWLGFSEGPVFHKKQFAVSYIHTAAWNDLRPQNKAALLPHTLEKLQSGQPLRIVITGSSTAVGGNNSGLTGAPPYCPNWIDMTVAWWRKVFGADITLTNVAKGGTTAPYGMEKMPETLAAQPDLVFIAFGGNDSFYKVPADTFIAQIGEIMAAVRAENPACEFVLVSSLLPSPLEKNFRGSMLTAYRDEMYKLEGEGVAVADVTAMHETLLRYKPCGDMLGNNINHPNDFFTRVYAQTVGFMLTSEEPTNQ